jgi:hypothetical protein
MDLIDRYVYAVTKNLPPKQRTDIEKELRTLIDDMVEECGEPGTYEGKVKNVLTGLGSPEKLADNYRDSKRYLIGPNYIDQYFMILKIVFAAVLIGVTVANAVE